MKNPHPPTAPQADHPLHKWQESIWLLLVLLTPLFVNLWVEQQFEASKIWLARTLIAGLFLLWLARLFFADGRQSTKQLPKNIRQIVIFLVAIMTIATLTSPNRTAALFGTLERANGLITQLSFLLFFGYTATQITAEQGRRLLKVAVLTAVPICLIGLAQAAGWQPLPVFTDGRSQLITTLGRSNFTGAYLALLLPATVAAGQTAAVKWERLGYGMLTLLELIVIGLTLARAAWVAAAFGLMLVLLLQLSPKMSMRNRRAAFGFSFISFGTGLLILVRQGIASGGSIAARWAIWKASLKLLWPHLWLGYGADTLELFFPAVYPPELVYFQGRGVVVDKAHNWLLDWSLSYGIVATGLFATLVFLVLRLGWRQATVQGSAENRPWTIACIAIVGSHLVGNLFLFDVAPTALLFWLSLAILVANSNDLKPTELPILPSLSSRWLLFGAATLAVGWGVWQVNARPLVADIYSWRGTQAFSQNDLQSASHSYSVAVAFQLQRAAYHVAFALTAAQLGQLEKAETTMLTAISLRPTDPVLQVHLASITAQMAFETQSAEKMTLAFDAFEQAIRLGPNIALTYQQYADLAFRAGNIPLARFNAAKAVDLDATDGISYSILGWSSLQLGDLPAAERAFMQAVKWLPNSADAHLGLATVYLQQNDLDGAERSLEQSLKADPTYPPALTLQLQLGD